MNYSEALRDARLNQIAAAVGGGGRLVLFSGEIDGKRCEDADPAGVLAEIELPSAPFRKADGGVLMLTESWNGYGHHTAGKGTTARSFRILDALGNCHIQGTVTANADEPPGDLLLDNPSIANGQKVSIGGFTFRELEGD